MGARRMKRLDGSFRSADLVFIQGSDAESVEIPSISVDDPVVTSELAVGFYDEFTAYISSVGAAVTVYYQVSYDGDNWSDPKGSDGGGDGWDHDKTWSCADGERIAFNIDEKMLYLRFIFTSSGSSEVTLGLVAGV